jgi:phosphoribosylanthranilate isomerase
VFVKICGITRQQDAALAAELGASAIGFIFWPSSPRFVDVDTASAIVRSVRGRLKAVGVFVNDPVEEVARIMETAGLDIAQLHGEESPEYCRQLNRTVIKAVGLKNGAAPSLDGFDRETTILVDAHDLQRRGGTGETVDWDTARTIAASRRTILSGGLNAGNIGQAIALVQPYGVDVSSGVEASPGVKDPKKLMRFFEALND